MFGQLRVCGVAISLMLTSTALANEFGEHSYAEPAPSYLRQFAEEGGKVFVLERFDAKGILVDRAIERVGGEITITGAVERRIAGYDVQLRGLKGCPVETVTYNRVQTWPCINAVRDYVGGIYNKRARVILCKTLVLSTVQQGQVIPASCFLLVGGEGEGEPYRTVNDDDSMVFLGLAEIGKTPDGRSRRPDLEHTQSLGKTMGFQNAD